MGELEVLRLGNLLFNESKYFSTVLSKAFNDCNPHDYLKYLLFNFEQVFLDDIPYRSDLYPTHIHKEICFSGVVYIYLHRIRIDFIIQFS